VASTRLVSGVIGGEHGDVPGCHVSNRKRVGKVEDWKERVSEQVIGALPIATYAHFGMLLHKLRLQRAMATRNEGLDVLALVYGERSIVLLRAGLALHGSPLEMGAYRELEAGLRLPDDPVRFLDALSDCLGLSEMDVATLLWQFAYDLLCAELGEAFAHKILSTGAVDR
jgi:hypothetical protein